MKPVVQHWTGKASRPAPGVAGAMKVCPRHEQAHRVTEPCPYCEEGPKAAPDFPGEAPVPFSGLFALLRGYADGMLLLDQTGATVIDPYSRLGKMLAPRGLLAWSGMPWRVMALAPGIVLEMDIPNLASRNVITKRSAVLPLDALTEKVVRDTWSTL